MSSLEEINRKIEGVAKEIEKVAKQIGEVQTAITTWENNSATMTKNYAFWEKRLGQLGDEKNNLQTEKNNLQTEKNKLRDEMLLLLQRQSDRGSAVDYNNNFHLDSPEHVNYAKLKAIKLMPYLATLNGHCVTIVSRNLFVTYAHHSHANLVVGTKCNNQARSSYPAVKLYNGTYVDCSVIMASKKLDCVWLKPDNPEELPSEIQEQQIELPYYCHKIIIMGLSGLYQIETPISFDICNISCSTPDESGHVKSNKKSSPGESGGPVFDFYNGRLVGMQVSSECSTGLLENNCGHYGGKAAIVPAILFFDYSDKNYDELNVVKPVSFASRVNVRTQSDSFETLKKKMKEILGNRVQDVIVSEDLISSQMPCFINLRNDVRNLEINPNHSAIVSLNNKVNEGSQDSLISHLVNTLFDESLCR